MFPLTHPSNFHDATVHAPFGRCSGTNVSDRAHICHECWHTRDGIRRVSGKKKVYMSGENKSLTGSFAFCCSNAKDAHFGPILVACTTIQLGFGKMDFINIYSGASLWVNDIIPLLILQDLLLRLLNGQRTKCPRQV